jgi:uncharacterized membrane protein YfcA
MFSLELTLMALVLFGLLGAVLNTIVGGGAGVILVPLMILVFRQSANAAIATTFVAVAIGAFVSTFAYGRQGRVDFRAGWLLSAFTLPGVILGAFLTSTFEGPLFDVVLGVVVMALGILMLVSPRMTPQVNTTSGWARRFTDAFATQFTYRIQLSVALPFAVATGLLAGTFGAGGGLVITPGLVLAGFPVHVALGTVRLVAGVLSIGASATRFSLGQVDLLFATFLAIGAVPGAFLGARIARVATSEFLRRAISAMIWVLGFALVLETLV